MNVRPKAILGYLVGCLLVVGFVVLFSVIFSFVGTIICAALAGMMMGAARLPWWQSFALSLVFPAVSSTLFRVTKAELPFSQVLFIALLCLAVFWVIYLAVWALTSHEQVRATAGPGTVQAAANAPSRCSRAAEEVTLDVLQGIWLARNGKPGPFHIERALEISNDTLLLTLTDSRGEISHFAQARFELNPGPARKLGAKPALPVCLDPETEVCI